MSLPTRLESLLPMASTFYLKWTTSSFFRKVSSQRYVKFPSGCINYLKVDYFDKGFLWFSFVWIFLGRHVHWTSGKLKCLCRFLTSLQIRGELWSVSNTIYNFFTIKFLFRKLLYASNAALVVVMQNCVKIYHALYR